MKLFTIFFVVIALIACNKKQEVNPLRAYYFPLDSLENKQVYEYRDPRNNIVTHYSIYHTTKNDKGTKTLHQECQNGLFEPMMKIVEREAQNGMLCQDYQFIQFDSTGAQKVAAANIKENVLFPFEFDKDSFAVYRFQMSFSLPLDLALHIDYTRQRRFKGFSEYKLKDQTLPAVIFETTENYKADDHSVGGAWDVNNKITETFAKGVGLVYYEKHSSADTMPTIYHLYDRYPAKK